MSQGLILLAKEEGTEKAAECENVVPRRGGGVCSKAQPLLKCRGDSKAGPSLSCALAEGQLEEGEWAGTSPGSSTLASGWNSSLAVCREGRGR